MTGLWFYGAVAGKAHGAQTLAKRKRSLALVEQKTILLSVFWIGFQAFWLDFGVVERAQWGYCRPQTYS